MSAVAVPLHTCGHLDQENFYRRTLWSQLDGLDFADDLALLPNSHAQIQEKEL